MNPDNEPEIHTALVEVEPGLAVVFGGIPDGLEVSPLKGFAIPDEANLSKAFAAAANLGNVSAQFANGISQAAGLVRLSPATLAALNSGSQPIASGAYNIGVLAGGSGKFSAQVMWAPAAAGTALRVAAAAGPAIAMLGIQVQLNQLTKIAEHSLALTGQVLRQARQAEWSELSGLATAIEKAVSEARHIGMVNDAVWDNIRGREADLNKLEETYRARVRDHVSELARLTDHAKRRDYLRDNGEAILRDASSAFESTNAWLKYQALRASHIRGDGETDDKTGRLAAKIAADAALTYRKRLEDLAEAMFALEGELWVMHALSGKRTLPFGEKKAHAEEVARLAATFAGYISELGAPCQGEAMRPHCRRSSHADPRARHNTWPRYCGGDLTPTNGSKALLRATPVSSPAMYSC